MNPLADVVGGSKELHIQPIFLALRSVVTVSVNYFTSIPFHVVRVW